MALIRICLLLLMIAPPGVAAQKAAVSAIERGLDATLVLYADTPEAGFLGSGFSYAFGDGVIGVTNAHVVGAVGSVVVERRDGTRTKGRVLARDMRRDIALLQLDQSGPGLRPLSGVQPIGTPVIALGAPLAAGFTATRGIVAADPRQVDAAVPLRLVQHDAAINPGSSGGPLIDMQGWLVGMNSQIANGSRLFVGIAYAISADDLARLVPHMLAGTLAPVPDLGLDLRPVNAVIAAGLGVAQAGLLVDHVQPESLADRAGIHPGDVLLAAQGKPIQHPGDLAFHLDGAFLWATVSLLRAGQVLRVKMALTTDVRPEDRHAAEGRRAPIGFETDKDGRVTTLHHEGIAARAGLLVGDRVLLANGQPATQQRLKTSSVSKPLVLLVQRDNRSLHIILSATSGPQPHRPIGGNRLDLAVERF